MHKNDVVAICSLIVGLAAAFTAGTPAAASLDTVTLGHGNYALAVIGILGIVASQIARVLGSPSSTQKSS